MPEPLMDTSRRGAPVVVDGRAARIWCENEHAIWVVFDGERSPVGYRREQVRTPDGAPLAAP
jgi:hypothetical protein